MMVTLATLDVSALNMTVMVPPAAAPSGFLQAAKTHSRAHNRIASLWAFSVGECHKKPRLSVLGAAQNGASAHRLILLHRWPALTSCKRSSASLGVVRVAFGHLQPGVVLFIEPARFVRGISAHQGICARGAGGRKLRADCRASIAAPGSRSASTRRWRKVSGFWPSDTAAGAEWRPAGIRVRLSYSPVHWQVSAVLRQRVHARRQSRLQPAKASGFGLGAAAKRGRRRALAAHLATAFEDDTAIDDQRRRRNIAAHLARRVNSSTAFEAMMLPLTSPLTTMLPTRISASTLAPGPTTSTSAVLMSPLK